MSQSLPHPRPLLPGETLGQCCHSLILIESAMSRLSLLLASFEPVSKQVPCGMAAGVSRNLAASWTELDTAHAILSGIRQAGGACHAEV